MPLCVIISNDCENPVQIRPHFGTNRRSITRSPIAEKATNIPKRFTRINCIYAHDWSIIRVYIGIVDTHMIERIVAIKSFDFITYFVIVRYKFFNRFLWATVNIKPSACNKLSADIDSRALQMTNVWQTYRLDPYLNKCKKSILSEAVLHFFQKSISVSDCV